MLNIANPRPRINIRVLVTSNVIYANLIKIMQPCRASFSWLRRKLGSVAKVIVLSKRVYLRFSVTGDGGQKVPIIAESELWWGHWINRIRYVSNVSALEMCDVSLKPWERGWMCPYQNVRQETRSTETLSTQLVQIPSYT
jgi:hypothetical protein